SRDDKPDEPSHASLLVFSAGLRDLRRARSVLTRFANQESGVVSSEAEGVRYSDLDIAVSRLMRHVVEIAIGILPIEVDRRRDGRLFDGEHADRGFHGAGRSDEMAVHGLRRADGE